jgi:hypothetical protein
VIKFQALQKKTVKQLKARWWWQQRELEISKIIKGWREEAGNRDTRNKVKEE